MKALFLTSNLGCSTKVGGVWVPVKCDNSNCFIDNLRKEVGDIKKLTIIASDPDNYYRLDSQANCVIRGLQLDGFSVEEVNIIDHRFNGDMTNAILSSDVVFLCGGHVPTQNKYFKEIKLQDILEEYNGVVVGMSAGSMNCSKLVYAQPESEEEYLDKNYQKYIEGLGLTNLVIMPHMNRAKTDELCGDTTYNMCLRDSYDCPHYGIEDGGYILIKDGIATSYGKTVWFIRGKEYVLCEDKQKIELEDNQVKCDK